jgi:molybdate transport system substrate-binding protein
MNSRLRFFALAAVALLASLPLKARAANSGGVVFFAAASLADTLPIVEKQYEAAGGGKVTFSFAASGTLAKQIEASGGVDLFMSADNNWMDYLAMKGLIQPATRKPLLGNALVLVAPKDSTANITIAPNFALNAALKGGKLAVGDPVSVPAGNYAKAALTSLGVWDSLSGNIANGENVRAVLEYVARGEAPLGIVYATDAISEPRVKIVGTFPESSHMPIVYPVALVKDAKPEAAKFLAYLEGPQAKAVFEKAGFTVAK